MKSQWVRVVGAVSVALFYALPAPAAIDPNAAPVDHAKVLVKAIALGEESDVLTFPARASSLVQTKIYSESDGVVRSLPVNVGSRITKRSEILVIRHTDPVYQYAPVRVTSPVSGIVSSLEVTEGTQVTRGQILATVTDPLKLRISVEVPAQDLSSLPAGLVGEFKASSLREPIKVRVLGVSPFVDAKTGTASAELTILDAVEKSGIMPGMLGQVSLKTNIHSAISIPEDAIIYREGKTLVRLLVDGKVKLSPVDVGARRRGNVEVLKGMKDKDALILRASRFVTEGETVEIETDKT